MAAVPRTSFRLREIAIVLALPLIAFGCAAPSSKSAGETLGSQPAPLPVVRNVPDPEAVVHPTITLASCQENDDKTPAPDKNGKKADNGDKQDEHPKQKITLPTAIQMCIANNFRLRAGEEKIRQAEADLVTASLIPNMTLWADYQLVPLQHADVNNQLGPPEADFLLTVPIDWLLFGKRVAAMQAAKLGIDVSNADFADMHRLQVARTVDAFYEILTTRDYLELAEENVRELQEIEKLTQQMATDKKAGPLELDRIKLAVLEALLERHDRELAFGLARAKLRPLIGRTAADEDFDVDGKMDVKATVPPPTLEAALALADAHRADLISDRHDIERSRANVEAERRKAWPRVDLVPIINYQNQQAIDGFRNGAMAGGALQTTLPFTDRNQGNILRARSREIEAQQIYHADRADVFAEVEASVVEYTDAVEHITQFNSPATIKAAENLNKNMDAAYRSGERRLHDLLNAHHAYRERLEHTVEFESTYWRKLNKLNMAVGLNAYDHATAATQPIVYPGEQKK
jgi:cobalt-zinc-cadmium efflux system outer membrane protein